MKSINLIIILEIKIVFLIPLHSKYNQNRADVFGMAAMPWLYGALLTFKTTVLPTWY